MKCLSCSHRWQRSKLNEYASFLAKCPNCGSRFPILKDDEFVVGTYELNFYIGDYFKGKGVDLDEPNFLDVIPVRFGISLPEEHYHVPLLVSPFSYSTYRGS